MNTTREPACRRLDEQPARDPESGANAIEYGMIATLVALVIMAAVSLIGDRVKSMIDAASGWF